MTKGNYEPAFLIPKGADRKLGDDGWDFHSENRIPSDVIEQLIVSFNLTFLEHYLGIDSFVGDNLKMSVIFDDNKKIELVSFQLYDASLESFKSRLGLSRYSNSVELFVPKD